MSRNDSYIAKTNFTAGEWSGELAGRTELAQFANSVRQLRDWILVPRGGVQTRDGTTFAARTKFSTGNVGLLPFEFNVDQTYAVEIGDSYMRFYADESRIELTAQNITAVGTAGGLALITVVGHGYANGNFVHIQGVLGAFEVNGDWEISNVAADTFRLVGSTVPSSYTSGGEASKIVEIVSPYDEADIPELAIAQTEDTAYIFHSSYPVYKLTRTAATTFTISLVDWLTMPFLIDNATATTITPGGTTVGSSVNMTSSAAVFDGTDINRHFRVANGVLKVTSFTSSTSVTATIMKTCVNVATADWAPGAWGGRSFDGTTFGALQWYPGVGVFYDNRLTVGKTLGKPQTFWSSKTGEYEDFDMSATTDDFAYEYRVASKHANIIRWIASDDTLFLGTSGAEFRAFGSNESGITPTNINVYPQAPHGCFPTPPVATSSGVVFVQRGDDDAGGPKLRLLTFSVEKNKYIATDLSILSNDITLPGLLRITYESEPNELIWGVRSDGKLTSLTLLTEQNVIAWALHGTDGDFIAVQSVSTPVGNRTWLIASRVIDSATVRTVEFFNPDVALDSAVHTTFGSPVTSITSGLEHLEGKTVTIIGDGAVYASQVVTNGALPAQVSPEMTDVKIGLPFMPHIELFVPTRDLPNGRSDGRQVRTAEVVLNVKDTIGLSVNGSMNYTRSSADDMDTAPVVETGKIKFNPDVDWDQPVEIDQTLPYKATILAAIQYVEIGD